MSEEKKDRLYLRPVTHDTGVAVHEAPDGHTCAREYRCVSEGENLTGRTVVALHADGTFEQLPTGATAMKCPHGGPAQVATADYRESWERTFGRRGGVS